MDQPEPTADDLFAPPPGEQWTPVSAKYLPIKRAAVVLTYGIWAVVVGVPLLIFTPWWLALLAAGPIIIFGAWRFTRMPRLVRSWGYLERETDLLIRSGVLFRSMVVVPYGRMQVIEITSGPLARHFKLAEVQLVTAAASSNASIPALDQDEARSLRDRLSALGQAQAAGL